MRTARSLAVIGLSLAGASHGAQAQGVTAGQIVTREIVVAGKPTPLPPGEWSVAGVGAGSITTGDSESAYGLIWNVVLMRPTADGRAVDAMIELNVNDLGVSDGWGLPSNCARKDIHLARIRYKSGWDASCFFITHSHWDWRKTATPAWTDAVRHARSRGWTLPQASVTSGLRVANRRDVIDARFHFLPAFHGIAEPQGAAWSQSPWRMTHLAMDERRSGFARTLAAWTELTSGYMEAGLKRRLPATPLPNPGVDAQTPERDSLVKQRLAALERLRKAGRISQANFDEQARMLTENKRSSASSSVDPAAVAASKTITYPPLAAASNLFIDASWVGQPFTAGVLLLLQTAADGVKFYIHEWAWGSLVGGPHQRDDARALDFAHEAVDG